MLDVIFMIPCVFTSAHLHSKTPFNYTLVKLRYIYSEHCIFCVCVTDYMINAYVLVFVLRGWFALEEAACVCVCVYVDNTVSASDSGVVEE